VKSYTRGGHTRGGHRSDTDDSDATCEDSQSESAQSSSHGKGSTSDPSGSSSGSGSSARERKKRKKAVAQPVTLETLGIDFKTWVGKGIGGSLAITMSNGPTGLVWKPTPDTGAVVLSRVARGSHAADQGADNFIDQRVLYCNNRWVIDKKQFRAMWMKIPVGDKAMLRFENR
jgi:hypothetical protein